MARNPKDLVVSYYQFHRSLRTMSYRGTFQEFCRRFMNDKCKCASRVGVTVVMFAAHCTPARAVLYPHPPVPTIAGCVGPAFPAHRSRGWGSGGTGSLSEVVARAEQSGRPTQTPCSLATVLGF